MRYGQRPRSGAPVNARDGERIVAKTRLAHDLHAAMNQRCDERSISGSAYIAQLIARDLGFPDPVLPDPNQEVLRLTG